MERIKRDVPSAQQTIGAPAYLLLANRLESQNQFCSDPDHCVPANRVNGLMIDDEKRSSAMVFGDSFLFFGIILWRRYSDLLQVCIHEVGHLFNLIHDEGKETAMAIYRSADIDEAWRNIGLQRPSSIEAYPFSRQSLEWISNVTSKPQIVLPWGDSFRSPSHIV